MQQIKLTLETVTPLFLGGAKGKDGPPELRPPAFRGAMRYWFRAIAGGVLGDGQKQMKLIRAKETEVFGNAEESEGQSPVWTRLSHTEYNRDYRTRLLPHRDNTFPNPDPNAKLKTLRNDPQLAIPIGTKPCLTLTLRPMQSTDKLETAIWSLLLAITFGGIGKRSRRAFGSFRLTEIEVIDAAINSELQQTLNMLVNIPEKPENLVEQVQQTLNGAFSHFQKFLNAKPFGGANLPKYSVIRQNTKIVLWTPKKTANWETALRTLMHKLSNTKAQNPGNFDDAFGRISRSRRASPLWVSAHPIQSHGTGLLLTHLEAEYTENFRGNQHHLVRQFMDTPPTEWQKMEVKP